jgi:kinesin family protein 6/9
MVATINPEAAHTEESLSTCRQATFAILNYLFSESLSFCYIHSFAQRVSTIKNRATVNEDLDPNAVIRRLKGEILNLREEIAFLKVGCVAIVMFQTHIANNLLPISFHLIPSHPISLG